MDSGIAAPNTSHTTHRSHQVGCDLSRFYVVTVLSNPVRYKRRYELYWNFKEMCDTAGVKLITVEQAFGNRPFMITQANNPMHLQLRSVDELWHKENMINLGVQHATRIDPWIKEVAWIDCDLRPTSLPRQWFEETWHELQHYQFVQMFESLINLDTESNPLDTARLSFMASYLKGGRAVPTSQSNTPNAPNSYAGAGNFWLGAPGGAWAANIEAFNHVGGLIDFCILGSADWHMAQGLLGILEPGKSESWSPGYSRRLYDWQARALRWIKKDVGYVKGGLLHENHGPHKLRYYVSRKQVLVDWQFDPHTDLKYDNQGLFQLETWDDRQINLRDDVRAYFRSRFEDTPEYKSWQIQEPGKK